MMKQLLVLSILTAVLFLSGVTVYAAESEMIYGSQLMTVQERNEHRERLLNAKTNEEREQIRKEHHARMEKRAMEQGKTLPDMPPSGGRMMMNDGDMGGRMGGGGGR
jgi:hypothetical protein